MRPWLIRSLSLQTIAMGIGVPDTNQKNTVYRQPTIATTVSQIGYTSQDPFKN